MQYLFTILSTINNAIDDDDDDDDNNAYYNITTTTSGFLPVSFQSHSRLDQVPKKSCNGIPFWTADKFTALMNFESKYQSTENQDTNINPRKQSQPVIKSKSI